MARNINSNGKDLSPILVEASGVKFWQGQFHYNYKIHKYVITIVRIAKKKIMVQ